jgi:chemotaxis protein MotB
MPKMSFAHSYPDRGKRTHGKTLAAGFARFTLGAMVKQALIIASVISVLLVVSLIAFSSYQQKRQFENVKAQLAGLQQSAEESSQQATRLQHELTNSNARVEALIKEKEQVAKTQKQMEDQMREAMQSRDVTISELQGKLTVNILDRLLFDSGEAELKPEGEHVLSEIAGVLLQHTNRQVYVIGHTDNVPVRASAFSRYPSNWELSTARATSAVRYLAEKAGVDPARLAAVGYGEYHPVADNSTAEGRAKNRRIAIVILPEQFNPIETVQGTNSPATSITPAVPSETEAEEASPAVVDPTSSQVPP